MKQRIRLEELIDLVDAGSPKADPLTRLADSVVVARDLDALADQLVDHYVGRAREAGASWADIGNCLGVTRQAAQQRFVVPRRASRRKRLFTKFNDRARAVVVGAQEHARVRGEDHIGTEHLLLAILDDADSLGARALMALEVTPSRLAEVLEPGSSGTKSEGHMPFTADTKKVLELSLREAIRANAGFIGTEHLVLAVLRAGDSPGSVILGEMGVTREAVEAWLRAKLRPSRRTSRSRAPADKRRRPRQPRR